MSIRIIILLTIIYSLKAINKFVLIDRNFNSFSFSAILNIQIADNGKAVYLTRNNSASLTIFQKYDITTETPKLLHTFTQPILFDQSIKNQIFYAPQWQQIIVYNQLKNQQILYNSTSFQYLDNFQYSISSMAYSLNFNIIFYIDIDKKLYFISKNQFKQKNPPNFLQQLNNNVVDLNNYPMQFSPNQKMFCTFTVKTFYGVTAAGFLIYNVSQPSSISLFRFLIPQEILDTGGGQQIAAIAWKNDDRLLMFYGLRQSICEYIFSSNTVNCVYIQFTIKSMIYFPYDDQLVFFIINATNSMSTSYTIIFTDATTKNSKHQIFKISQFQITNARFKLVNDTLFVIMKGLRSAEILLIKQNCPAGFYYDYCKSTCMTFHQFCTTLDTPGCSCKQSYPTNEIEKYFTIEGQFQFKFNIIQIIIKNQALNNINQITGMRGSFRLISSYYLQLADFFLYSYHDRQYNFIMNHTIIPIKQLQQRKWKLFQFNEKIQLFQSLQTFQENLSYKQKFSPQKYIKFEQKSSQFFINTTEFLIPNSILSLIIFLMVRIILNHFIKGKIGHILNIYKLWSYFIITLIDGNQQFFSYLCNFEFKYFFMGNYYHKISQSIITLIFFLLFLFVSSSFYIFRYLHKKQASQFFENVKDTNLSAFYMTSKGLRLIFLGMVHILINNAQQQRLYTIILIEMAFFCQAIVFLSLNNFFEIKIISCVDVYLAFLRIILVSTFLLKQQTISKFFNIAFLDCQISFILIILYFSFNFGNLLIKMLITFKQFLSILYFKKKQKEILNKQHRKRQNLKTHKYLTKAIKNIYQKNFQKKQHQIPIELRIKKEKQTKIKFNIHNKKNKIFDSQNEISNRQLINNVFCKINRPKELNRQEFKLSYSQKKQRKKTYFTKKTILNINKK